MKDNSFNRIFRKHKLVISMVKDVCNKYGLSYCEDSGKIIVAMSMNTYSKLIEDNHKLKSLRKYVVFVVSRGTKNIEMISQKRTKDDKHD